MIQLTAPMICAIQLLAAAQLCVFPWALPESSVTAGTSASGAMLPRTAAAATATADPSQPHL